MKGTNPAYLCAPCGQSLCEGPLASLHRQVHFSPSRPEGALQTALSQGPYCLLACLEDKGEKGVWHRMGWEEKRGLSGEGKPCECGQPRKRPGVSILLSQAQVNQVQKQTTHGNHNPPITFPPIHLVLPLPAFSGTVLPLHSTPSS